MRQLKHLWADTRGFIVTSETILLGTVALLGCIVGFSVMRNSIVTEFGDSAAAVNRLNQSAAFTTTGADLTDCDCGYSILTKIVGSWSVQWLVPNLSYVDQTDECETVQAPADDSPSCMDLYLSAIAEGDPP